MPARPIRMAMPKIGTGVVVAILIANLVAASNPMFLALASVVDSIRPIPGQVISGSCARGVESRSRSGTRADVRKLSRTRPCSGRGPVLQEVAGSSTRARLPGRKVPNATRGRVEEITQLTLSWSSSRARSSSRAWKGPGANSGARSRTRTKSCPDIWPCTRPRSRAWTRSRSAHRWTATRHGTRGTTANASTASSGSSSTSSSSTSATACRNVA